MLNGDIWLACGDGSGERRIIRDAESPCWAPDHKRLTFARKADVWVANADGSHQRRLTHRWNPTHEQTREVRGYDGGRDVDISWEPRDNIITFSHWERFRLQRVGDGAPKVIGCCSIYAVPVAKPKAGEVKPWFDAFDNEARFRSTVFAHPAWSRSGKFCAFMRDGDIWAVMRAEPIGDPSWPSWSWMHRSLAGWGWDVARLAAVAEYDAPTYRGSRENCFVTHLSWSPDARCLAYGMNRVNGSGFQEIRVLHVTLENGVLSAEDADGHLLGSGFDPCFSPDGRFVAYMTADSSAQWFGIIARSLDGKRAYRLVRGGRQPAW